MASDHHDYIIPCDCHGDHFLRISWWDDDPEYLPDMDMSGWMSLGGDYSRGRLRDRLKRSLKMLRKGHADTYVGVVLTAAKCREAAVMLLEYADAEDRARNARAQAIRAAQAIEGGSK